jgi:hypothetical protein
MGPAHLTALSIRLGRNLHWLDQIGTTFSRVFPEPSLSERSWYAATMPERVVKLRHQRVGRSVCGECDVDIHALGFRIPVAGPQLNMPYDPA